MSNLAKAKAKTTLLYIKKYAILTKVHVNFFQFFENFGILELANLYIFNFSDVY